ncbi:MAG: fasciclin domain-containing protein [Bacteroidota bacterium]
MIATFFTSLCFSGCKKWEDHTAATDAMVGKDIFQQIKENSDLSKFAELLTKSGYDKIISSSQTYTVFAPANSALASIDPAVVANDAKLKLFVGNHITNQLQPAATNGVVRLQMLNGKYNNLQAKMLEQAIITTSDKYGKNGILHIIDKMVPALNNAWEFLQSDPLMPANQKTFLLAQTDSANTNLFLRNVLNLRDEQKQFTFFVLVDTAFTSEVNKYKQYFVTGSPDSTTKLATTAVVNDFAVEGVYAPASIPDTILSKFNTKVGIDKSTIVQTVKVSNGIVYIMSKLAVLPRHKFQQYIIQGENYSFSRADRRNNTYFRDKFNPVTATDFRDVLVFGHGLAQFYLGYRLQNVPSLKFKAYWVALHDNINSNAATFRQLLGIGTPLSTSLPYTTVAVNNYNEVYLGEFTMATYSPFLNVHLTADNSTNNDANKITVDYIRLEPVL